MHLVATVAKQVLGACMQSEKPLGMMLGLEAPHLAFSLARGLMRHLGPIVGVLLGVVDRRGQSATGGRPVAAELVGDQPPRLFPLALQDLAKESLGGPCVATALHEDIECIAILVDKPDE